MPEWGVNPEGEWEAASKGVSPREGQGTPGLPALLGQSSEPACVSPPSRVCVCVCVYAEVYRSSPHMVASAGREWVGVSTRGGLGMGSGMLGLRMEFGLKARLETCLG